MKDIQNLIEKLPIEKKLFYQNKLKNKEEKENLFEREKEKEEDDEEVEIEEGEINKIIEEEFTKELELMTEELKLKSKIINDTIKEDDHLLKKVEDLTNENMKHLSNDHIELKKYESKLNQSFNQYYLLLISFILFLFIYAIIKIFPK